MRALTPVAIVGCLLAGCMAPPEAEELVLLDEDREAIPELLGIPYDEAPERVAPHGEEVSEPATEPASRRGSSRPRIVADTPGPDACWGAEATGFPAISDDGTTLVVPQANHLQLSYIPGRLALEWHDLTSGLVTESQPIVIHDETFDETDERACARVARGIRRRAHATNVALSAVRWRAMERLPVAILDTYASDESREQYLVEVPPRDRVVQVVRHLGEIVVRIPGVEVLERHSLLGGDPFEVYGDRISGTVVLVTVQCAGDSCTCDPIFTSHVLRWNPETFEAIEARPCVAGEDGAAQSEGEGEGWTSCEPIDYGFDMAPWAF